MLGFVIGDNKMVMGFRLVGVEGVEVTTIDEARDALSNTLSRSDVALIMISQQFSPQLQAEIERIRASRLIPLIVELPGAVGPRSEMKLSEQISKTLGIKIKESA